MRQQVEETIEVIRPALQADGGDIVLRDVDEEHRRVTVTLVGACGTCPASTDTLKAGIERIMTRPRRRRHRSGGGLTCAGMRDRESVPACSRPPGPVIARALARLLSLVERGGEAAREVGRLAYPLGGQAYTVGHHRRARAPASRR